jgi:hypothetical protein
MRSRPIVSDLLASLLLPLLLLLLVARPCLSAVYTVHPDGSGDFPTIQAALDAAAGGDDVVLTNGTFQGPGNVDLHFLGKAVTLRSQSGDPATCTIDCRGAGGGRGLNFDAGETRGTRVESITVKGGYVFYPEWPGGGGAYCYDSSPTLHNLVFTECGASNGNGISTYGGSPLLHECTFSHSMVTLPSMGGAIYTLGSDLEIEDCVFYWNSSSEGGAIWSSGGATLHIIRTAFTANIGSGAALWCHDSTVELADCTLFHNLWDDAQVRLSGESHLTANHTIIAFADMGNAAVQCLDGSTAMLSCCDVYGNSGGDWVGCLAGQAAANNNMWADPVFCSMDNIDPHLRSDSPCAEANNAGCGQIGALGVACDGPVPVRFQSWGQIKSRFRGASRR